ncbi:MAG: hypothetical protein UT39_C0012G0025 [Candidatus Woesebacteria bacterium GW2011_GWA1_39_21]|uniref:NodB homology domain-containing protein n=1 Tax=Candidatus Woesebacteria bacterium GW2011_GWA1_39_21 TaxID=1618550 RepID=A0A0G0N6F8_9BACT|nr:MAG: hypothetical protein UT39_C0012G0025 [Candidatus Woesebacteria bacterium GW2011_GWA1_39_21]
MQLNLIFHNVVESERELNNKYTVTLEFLKEIIERIELSINNQQTVFKNLNLYFDDGYESFESLVLPYVFNKPYPIKLSVITQKLGQKGYLNKTSIRRLVKQNILIVSHGVSHSALAVYKDSELQLTAKGGVYRNSPFGQGEVLSDAEVLYQLIESKKSIETEFKIKCDEFVFPYGLYNNDVVALNYKYGIYTYMSTCDEYLDGGQFLKPRYLIDHERNVRVTI